MFIFTRIENTIFLQLNIYLDSAAGIVSVGSLCNYNDLTRLQETVVAIVIINFQNTLAMVMGIKISIVGFSVPLDTL